MAKNKVNLFYILKINSSDIVANKYSIDTDFKSAKNDGKIIAIGDNQVLRFIRTLKEQPFDNEYVKSLYKKRRELVNGNATSKEIQKIQNEINEKLFVPDLVTVKTDTTKRDYKAICKNKFTVRIEINGTEYKTVYKRLCAGAGQLRRNSAFFVNEELYDWLEQIMMCGLSKNKIGKINIAKFNAYYSLYTSAINKVATPRFVVIPDYEYTLKNQNVDWIYNKENGEPDIETRIIDFNINAFDGSGIISPEMAEKWQKDLKLDYLPSSFITRAPFLKGLLSVFDFKKFAKEIAHKDTIVDIYGTVHNVEDIDAILTKSQFKMAKHYESLEQYNYYFRKYNHIFGVTRVNKKESDFVTPLNYQYIQSNFFTEDTIKELAKPTTDWIDNILRLDPVTIMMLMVGYHENQSLEEIENGLDNPIAKCLLYNHDILKDDYVKSQIRKTAQKKIDQAKIGKIYVEGSYDFQIPDLYALCEWAFNMPVKGLLPAKTLWSRRWVEKGATRVSCQRSPLVASAENQILNIYYNDECNKWFKYIYWGNILNIWDLTAIAESDSDYDGDLILTSDNQTLINAINPDQPVITYEKQKAKEQRLNYNSFATFDTKSFDSPIGSITNLASNMYAMLPNYSQDSREYQELWKRIKLMRRKQGDAIDLTKGIAYTPPPKHWSKRQKYVPIPENASLELQKEIESQNEEIKFNNSICCNKKTYFFGYVYPKKMQEYKRHKKTYDKICRIKFKMSINDLIRVSSKTDSQKKLLKEYYKYSPLLNSKCTMNMLCKYIEDMDYGYQRMPTMGGFDYTCMMSCAPKDLNDTKICHYRKLLKKYSSTSAKIMMDIELATTYVDDTSKKELKSMMYDALMENFMSDSHLCESDGNMVANYLVEIYHQDKQKSFGQFIWNCYGDVILNNIRANSKHNYWLVENRNGKDCFGKKLSVIDNYIQGANENVI